MAELLKRIEGTFVLSLNDKLEVRELFGEFTFETVEVTYTCNNGKNLKSPELIIRNFA